jgi:hypothetical protein
VIKPLVLIAVRGDERAGSFLQPALHKGFNVLSLFAVVVLIGPSACCKLFGSFLSLELSVWHEDSDKLEWEKKG